MLPTRVEIPTGYNTTIMVAKLPLAACGLLVLLVGYPFMMFKTLMTLWIAPPLWGFFRFHARRDPLFLPLFLGQMALKRYYRRG